MCRLPSVFIMTIAFICMIFSFFAILGGDLTSAPVSGFGKIEKGENLNDVHSLIQSKNGEIYTLGYTCVQKFNKSGEFIGGAYYTSNSLKRVSDNEFLSLNEGRVVLLNCAENIIYIFNDNFDVVDSIEVSMNYDKEEFYANYPNIDAADKEIRISFLSNIVISEDSRIKLEAPRNRLFSRDIGMLLLIVSVVVLWADKWRRE